MVLQVDAIVQSRMVSAVSATFGPRCRLGEPLGDVLRRGLLPWNLGARVRLVTML